METGWMSKFDIDLGIKRRIILHGNIMDSILESREGASLHEKPLLIPLMVWLQERLSAKGYCRIVTYNQDTPIRVIQWDGLSREEAERAIARYGFSTAENSMIMNQPAMVLNALGILLAQSERPTAVIIPHSELRIHYPSQEAVSLHRLTESAARIVVRPDQVSENEGRGVNEAGRGDWSAAGQARADEDASAAAESAVIGSGGRSFQNLAILLYTRENDIPQEFVSGDPYTSLILVPRPNYTQRLQFIEGCHHQFHSREDTPYDLESLARITEGYRMSELDQIVRLSQQEEISADQFPLLQTLFKFGRKDNRWAEIQLDKAENFFLNKYRIRGQDEIVSQVIDSLYRAKHRISSLIDQTSQKPPIVLFFVGSTGVGKTMMARAMSEFITGSTDNFKIIDMSEYRQDHSDQKLIGAPPGYVGFIQGGQLTNFVKEKPFSVVLMDEVEKGNEKILDLLLQILDGARLTDGKGETVDFSETCLIFTSNIGTEEIKEEVELDRNNRGQVTKYFKNRVEEYFGEYIERPEIYNRLKRGILVFNFIEEETAKKVLVDKLKNLSNEVNSRLEERGRQARIDFSEVDENDMELVHNLLRCVDYRTYGLRDVDNIIEVNFGTALAKFLDDLPNAGTFHYGWDQEKDRVIISEREE